MKVIRMLRYFLAVLAGWLIWLVANFIFALISVWIWGHDPDRYFAIALQCWLGSSAAFATATVTREHIAPDMSERTFVVSLACVVLLWAALSMISGIDIDYKAVALAAHAFAALIAYRLAVPKSRA